MSIEFVNFLLGRGTQMERSEGSEASEKPLTVVTQGAININFDGEKE